jgi:hypothetical protein
MTETLTAEQKLAALRKAREEKNQVAAAKRAEQELADELAIEPLRDLHGDALAVVVLNVHFEGLPVIVAAEPANAALMKRHRASVKVQIKDKGTTVEGSAEAAEQLARSCLAYPTAEVFAALCAKAPGLAAQLGQEIVKVGQAKSYDDAKS